MTRSNTMATSESKTKSWGDLLQQALRSHGARGGAVWLRDGLQLQLAAVAGLNPVDFSASDEIGRMRQDAMQHVAKYGEPQMLDRSTVADANLGRMLFIPIERHGTVGGIVELDLDPETSDDALLAALDAVRELCRAMVGDGEAPGAAALAPPPVSVVAPPVPPMAPPLAPPPPPVMLAPPRTPEPPKLSVAPAAPPAPPNVVVAPVAAATPSLPPPVDIEAVLRWLLQVQSSLNLKTMGNVAVNEARQLFKVDRVSLVAKRHGRPKVVAVSGQADIHPRAQTVKSLQRLCQPVMQTGEPLRFPQESDHLPPELEEPLSDFVHLGGAHCLVIVPLRGSPESPHNAEPQTDRRRDPLPPVIGALVIELFESMDPPPALQANLDAVTDHLGAALHNVLEHESMFLMPVWRALGWLWQWIAKHRLVTVASTAAVVAVGTALVVVPWDYRVEATGRLMPSVQRDVFAPQDGDVQDVLVSSGERVREGDPLLKLRNNELQTEHIRIRNEFNHKRQMVLALQAQHDTAEKAADRAEATRLQGKMSETMLEVAGLRDQLKLLDERLQRLTVRAPISGVVTTFQVEQLLHNRPVSRGDVLLQVMDDRGEWRLELEVQEQRLGHMQAARSTLGAELPIEYRLLTRPDASYRATLMSVSTRANDSEEKGSIIEARAALDNDRLPNLSIGAEVRGRISCGAKPLGYVLFGDVVEFVQRYLWW